MCWYKKSNTDRKEDELARYLLHKSIVCRINYSLFGFLCGTMGGNLGTDCNRDGIADFCEWLCKLVEVYFVRNFDWLATRIGARIG